MVSSWLLMCWARLFYLAIVFFLTVGLLKAIKLYLRRLQLQRDLRDFSGPSPHWLTGNQQMFHEDNLEVTEELVKKYPCAFLAWIGPFETFVYIYDPDYVKTILNQTDPKSRFLYKFLIPLIGKGLLNLNGSKWFQHRRIITPLFHFNTLKAYVSIMAQSVNIMLDKWEEICGTQDTSMEVFEDISLMCLDTLMKCTFSQETNCQRSRAHHFYVKGLTEAGEIIFNRLYHFLYHYDIIFKFSPENQRLQKLVGLTRKYTEEIIQKRRKAIKDDKEHGKTEKRKYRDFLDILLSSQAENGNSFSDTDLFSEVNTFMVAGQDTIGGSLSWLLYHLAQNPEHQEKCREEIRGIVGDGSSITWDQLGEMSYTKMCIKESLRLFPTVQAISKELSKRTTFPDGRSLPAGTTVVVSIWGLHRNPAVWENPKVFDPLRFSPENFNKKHTYSYIPFSAGPRNCIGQHFAMTELKVAIALILLRFKISLDPTKPLSLVPKVLLKPKNGFYLSLKKIS
ncbi:PREDICTED: cytochrome P450 4X1 [Miniopterus natalensis]|uniref:cytochrome P450 4X1 n=1 Tax=Miniopterus natalensis TaxID=291302 RepID=UPI0007A6C067|nr:PREDICTED: cytochrome P450 4X1 [Miniopterus natalensis]